MQHCIVKTNLICLKLIKENSHVSLSGNDSKGLLKVKQLTINDYYSKPTYHNNNSSSKTHKLTISSYSHFLILQPFQTSEDEKKKQLGTQNHKRIKKQSKPSKMGIERDKPLLWLALEAQSSSSISQSSSKAMFLSGFSLRDKKDESSSECDVVPASSSVSYSCSSIWSSESSFPDKIRLWLFPFLEKFLAWNWNWNWNDGFLVE